MECQAKLEWREDKRLSCYQSYILHLRDVRGEEEEEWQLMVICESKAAAVVRVAIRKGGLRRLVSDHVTQGRASVLFSDQEKDMSAIDIRHAPTNRLRVFVHRLSSFLPPSSLACSSSPSVSTAGHFTPACGIKRKINISGRHHQSYGAKMLAASLAAQQPTSAGNTKSFYKESPGSLSPSPYRSPGNHPPAAKRSLLLEHTSTPKRLILSESSSVSPRRRPALKELSHIQSATSTGSGFTNLGNTCYMNAVLQSLLSLKPFTADLVNAKLVKIVHQDSLYRWLYLLAKYKESDDSITSQHICLNKIRRALSASANTFASYNEQDAHELLNHCMDQLRIDVTSSSDTAALCPVENNFKSVIHHTIKCIKCTHSITSSETVYDYTLQLPQWVAMSSAQQTSIQQLMEDYFNLEQVDYTCSECQCSSSSISHKLVQLPRILVLTLKRYNSHSREKRVDAVRIPRHLVLSPLCSTTTIPPTECSRLVTIATSTISPAVTTQSCPVDHKDLLNLSEDEQLQLALEMSLNDSLQCGSSEDTIGPPSPQLSSSQEEQEHTYRLASVISHVGKGTSTGHYVSDALAVDGGQWLSYNDSVVTPTSEEKVRQSRKMSGYIFFYLYRNVYQRSS